MDAAVQILNAAIAAFEGGIVPNPADIATLTAAINAAQAKLDGATEGTNPGNYAVGSKATLQAAIDTATTVKNNGQATQAQVDAAVQTLNNVVAIFEAGKVPTPAPAPAQQAPNYPGTLLISGSTSDNVKQLQARLNALGYDSGAVDGIFGPKTKAAVQAFQSANGLGRDGIVGPLTWGKLFGSGTQANGYPGLVRYGISDSVKAIQTKLNSLGYNSGSVDGKFGPRTLAAVKAFQTAKGLEVDGIVGNQTWGALFN